MPSSVTLKQFFQRLVVGLVFDPIDFRCVQITFGESVTSPFPSASTQNQLSFAETRVDVESSAIEQRSARLLSARCNVAANILCQLTDLERGKRWLRG